MFAVHRQESRFPAFDFCHDEGAGHDERLFVRQSDGLPGADGFQERPESHPPTTADKTIVAEGHWASSIKPSIPLKTINGFPRTRRPRARISCAAASSQTEMTSGLCRRTC